MKSRLGYCLFGIVGLALWTGSGCPSPTSLSNGSQNGGSASPNTDVALPTTLTITLFNDSCGTYIAPKFGVCPNGMTAEPHHFVDPPAVLAPGKSITYTTDQVAGATDGNCSSFPTAFTVGIPGWGYGPTSNPDTMTYVDSRFVGVIGVQFNCGDTIRLRWSNCDTGSGQGSWTSEVIPGPGNAATTTPFVIP